MRSESGFIEDRNNDLIRAFRDVMCSKTPAYVITHREIMSLVVASKSVRFWVTPESLYKAILRIRKGDTLMEMKEKRREMFFHLYNIFREVQKKDKTRTALTICKEIVYYEAPEFYIGVDAAIKVYNYQIKKNRRELNERYV